MSKKTNVQRILEDAQVPYALREYVVDTNDLSAVTAAQKLGLEPSQVFKTLVARGDKTGVLLVSLPGDAQLDLKALARLSRNKRVEMVP